MSESILLGNELVIMDSVFDLFYASRMGAYTAAPPSSKRGGRPRLDRNMFQASLLQITSMNGANIAKLLKFSHITLRRWNTEVEYKALLERNRNEFVQVFIEKLDEKIQEYQARMNEEFKATPTEFVTQKRSRFEMEFFGRPQDYSMRTITNILSMWADRIMVDDSMLIYVIFFKWLEPIPALSKKNEKMLRLSFKKTYIELEEKLRASLIENTKGVLLNQSPTNEDINFIIYTLELLEAHSKK